MNEKPSIIIASNCNDNNERIKHLLYTTNAFEILEVCSQGDHAENILFIYKPDFAIISANYINTNGITIARRLKVAGVPTKLAFITSDEDINEMRLALELGVKAYFNYSNDNQIVDCLDALCNDEYYIDTELYHKHYFAMSN